MMEDEGYFKCAREAAVEAGQMLKKNIRVSREISFKGAVDLVTNFDMQAQEIIYRHLSRAYPDHSFLGEEGLSQKGDADFCWIFDPLDGTTNYAHAFPVFCVSLALEHKGKIILGLVYDPRREEMFWALDNRGAYLNGRSIQVSSVNDLDRSLLATGFPYDLRVSPINNVEHFCNFIVKAQAVRRCGSAALDLCYVACGRFDGFWELKLKPWDVAAGILIIKEAGGRVSDFEGGECDFRHPEILASNGLIHQSMIDVIRMSHKDKGRE